MISYQTLRQDLTSKPADITGDITAYTQTTDLAVSQQKQYHAAQGTRYLTIAPLDGSFGRLGNFCFRYASALGIAKANNMTLVLPDTKLVRKMRNVFQITAPLVSELNVNTSDFVKVWEKHWGVFDTRHFFLSKVSNVTLYKVYSQSWKYFYPIQKLIKSELKPQITVKNASVEFRNRLKAFEGSQKIVIGVHVRRGDFLKPELQDWGYAVAPAEYFSRAIKYFIDKFTISRLIFIVATDDRHWCEKSLNFTGAPYHYTAGHSAVEDFNILSQCDHHIISVGSFGWWTAWLGTGTVVYYKDFPTPGSTHSKNHNPPDYYPSKWVGMS